MSRKKEEKDALDPWLEEKPENRPDSVSFQEMNSLEDGFQNLINTDPRYSLEIDPEKRFSFTQKEEDLIRWMVQYKNVQFVSTVMMNIPIEEGIEIYKRYDVQFEIKRINMAMYARRFASKMADLDALGGYLTSGLIDDNVPVSERWSPKDKLAATKLLMTLNAMKRKGLESPMVIEGVEIQKDLERLSPNELKQLIAYNDEDEETKEKLIALINEDGLLTMEELKNLHAMPISELEDLANTIVGEEPEYEE